MKPLLLLTLLLTLQIKLTFSQSFNPLLAEKLQYTLDSFQTANNIKGISACVILPASGSWKGVSGNSHAGTPITTDMEFGIASNTKLFTGVLLLKLAEHGIINLDDSLHEYLPTLNHVDSTITIRQLLNQTSGLADVNDIVGYADSVLSNPNHIYTPIEVVTWIGEPLFTPGSDWNYSNTNYILAGMIAESATGQSYAQLLRDSIFTPLSMDSTFLDVYDSILFTRAHPWQNSTDNSATPRKALNSVAWAAGALYSTAGEMAHWYHSLFNGPFLNGSSINELSSFVGSGNYSVGLFESSILGRTVWHHGGSIWGGYNSSMMYDTATSAVICVLINQNPSQAVIIARKLLSDIIGDPLAIEPEILQNHTALLYPNPSNGLVQIDESQQEIEHIRIINISGETVLETQATRFSMIHLPNGLYLVEVSSKGHIKHYRMLKQ